MYNQKRTLCSKLLQGLCCAAAVVATLTTANAQSLRSADTFAVLGATTVTNTGSTTVSGDLGVSPGTAITGFPPGVVQNGNIHANDSAAVQAHADLGTAYTAFAGLDSPPANNMSGVDLGGKTLTPGVYRFNGAANSSGILTFDAQGDSSARFVIQIGTTFLNSGNSSVVLVNGASARNIFFQVGSSATLAAGSSFVGTILAYTSVTGGSGATVIGRLLAVNAAVTLDTNTVTRPALTLVGAKADFDGDGDGDFVLQNTQTGERIIRFLQNGVYQSGISLGLIPIEWKIVGAADFDGDGYSDIIGENTNTGERRIWFLRNGVPQRSLSLGITSTNWHIGGAADFNGDGYADIIADNIVTGERRIALLQNGVFQKYIVLGTAPAEWRIRAAADFNADGYADLAAENVNTGERRIYFLRDGVTQSKVTFANVSTDWTIAGAADFDADGYSDVVGENTVTRERTIWFLRNGVFQSQLTLPTGSRAVEIADH